MITKRIEAASGSRFNRQGRHVSDSMRVAAFVRYLDAIPKESASRIEKYRGFRIEQNKGRSMGWGIAYENGESFPFCAASLAKAKAAVDACIEVRELAVSS